MKVRITLWMGGLCSVILLLFLAFVHCQNKAVYLRILDSALLSWGYHLAENLDDAEFHTPNGELTASAREGRRRELSMGFARLGSWVSPLDRPSAVGSTDPEVVVGLAHKLGLFDHDVTSRMTRPAFFTESFDGRAYRVLMIPTTARSGEPCLAYAPIESFFIGTADNLALRFGVMGFLILLVIVCGCYLFAGYLVGPIDALRHVSSRIAEGHLDEALSLTGSFELASLSESINHMRTSISDKIGEAETRALELSEKGEELAAANKELERAIFQANQMAADAEIRNYEMEQEVNQRRKAEEALRASEEKYRTIVENIREGYCEVDREGVITFANKSMAEITGYEVHELVGQHRGVLIDEGSREDILQAFSRILMEGDDVSELDYPIIRKDGKKLHVGVSVTVRINRAGERVGYRTIVRDVEARKRYEEELIHMAYHDPLTGLKNRKGFYEKLQESIVRATRYGSQVGLLYVDVDRFKMVNDTLGHEAGDQVLREISSRLLSFLRQSDCVSRLGGDEFAVILDSDRTLDVDVVVRKVVGAICQPYEIGDSVVDYISGSVGVALFPDDAVTAADLVKFADDAMYRLKHSRNCEKDRA